MVAPLNKDIILTTLEKHQNKLKTYGVKKIGLFGSYARGEQKRGSDIDILVEFDHPTFDNYMDLKFFLEDTFKRKIDLVMREALIPRMKYVEKETLYA